MQQDGNVIQVELQAGSDPAFLLLGDEDQVDAEVASGRKEKRSSEVEVWSSSMEPRVVLHAMLAFSPTGGAAGAGSALDPGLKANQSSCRGLLMDRSLHQQVLQVLQVLQVQQVLVLGFIV